MSWASCNGASNNIHFDFPPIMNDGRNFATWQPGAVISENIKKQENIKTNWDYRNYLTKNADTIIKTNQLNACNDCCACPGLFNTNQAIPNIPYLYKSCLDKGQPYGYHNSDLKTTYLSRTELQQRMAAPILSQEEYLSKNYPNPN